MSNAAGCPARNCSMAFGCGPAGSVAINALRNSRSPSAVRWEVVDRMTDVVGVNMLAEVEANRKVPRAGALRVVVGNVRNPRKVREADRHRRGIPVQMRRPCQRSGFRGRGKCPSQQEALGMRGSEPRMNTAISFVKGRYGFSARGQEFFVRRRGMARSSIQSLALLALGQPAAQVNAHGDRDLG